MAYQLQHITENDIRRVAALARQQEPDEVGRVDMDDLAELALADPSPEEVALNGFVDALTREQKLELIGLMYMGRGDDDNVPRLSAIFEKDADREIARKITEKAPALRTYLESALAIIAQ